MYVNLSIFTVNHETILLLHLPALLLFLATQRNQQESDYNRCHLISPIPLFLKHFQRNEKQTENSSRVKDWIDCLSPSLAECLWVHWWTIQGLIENVLHLGISGFKFATGKARCLLPARLSLISSSAFYPFLFYISSLTRMLPKIYDIYAAQTLLHPSVAQELQTNS